MGDLLQESVRRAPVVPMGSYRYFVHPLTDGIPALEPALLREAVAELQALASPGAQRIVTTEAMGIPVATGLSLATGLPLTVARKRAYGLPGEVAVEQSTGYGGARLHLNGVEAGTRVLVVDDVVSTGGTLLALLDALDQAGAHVVDVLVVFEKGEGRERVERACGRAVKTLLRVEVDGDHAVPTTPS